MLLRGTARREFELSRLFHKKQTKKQTKSRTGHEASKASKTKQMALSEVSTEQKIDQDVERKVFILL